jgi:selenocysteine lyase/cysteine desulfurase
MPEFLPDRLEAGTLNVPGIAGLDAGLRYVNQTGVQEIFRREHIQLQNCVRGLKKIGFRVFAGDHQASTVSFLPKGDCEEFAEKLGRRGIAVRAGLHCAPLAHESAGTLPSGTVRVSFGYDTSIRQTNKFLQILTQL